MDTFTLRLDEKTKNALKVISEKEERSQADCVRRLIRREAAGLTAENKSGSDAAAGTSDLSDSNGR